MSRQRRFGLIVALSIVLLAIGTPIAYAADLTVNTTGDEVLGDGWCSLREAIRSINQGSNYGGCIATGSAYGTNDTITFGSPGIYDLTIAGANEDASATGDLDILVPVTINGATTNRNDTIVQASIVDRVFDIFATPVTLQYLTIRKGTLASGDGGGIRVNSDASLMLFADRVTSNSTPHLGGGVVNSGTLQLSVSEVSLNSASSGGGIYNGSSAVAFLQVSGIFTNTSSSDGGGLTNLGQVNSGNTRFIANTATVQGGGIGNSGTITFTDDSRILNNSAAYGGGIRNFGVITMTTGAIGNNIAANGGGIHNNNGTIALDFVTVSSNQAIGTGGNGYGGGIYNYGVLSIVDGSRIYSNTAGVEGGGIYHTSAGSVLDMSDSDIVSNTAQSSGGGLFNNLNTRAVLTNVNISSNTTHYAGGGIYSNGQLAMSDDSLMTNTTDNFGAGLYNEISGTAILTNVNFISHVVTGGSGFVNIGVMTTTLITASDNAATTCAGFTNGGPLHLIEPTISLNHANNYGGGGCNNGPLTIDGGEIISNTAGDTGGLLNEPGGQTILNAVTVRGNVSSGTAFGGAGGLMSNGRLTLNGGQVISNTSAANGGGIANWNFGVVTITNGALIAYNSAVNGGGIHNTQGTLIMNGNAKVISNTGSREGGGLYQSADANAQLTDVTFSLNRARLAGGGLAQRVDSTIIPLTPTLSLTNVALLSNTAVISNGGAIFNAGILTVTGSSIVSNTANELGGGVWSGNSASLIGVTIRRNDADRGSGLYNNRVMSIDAAIIAENVAASNGGGGLYNSVVGTLTMTQSTIDSNRAYNAAAIRNYGTLTMRRSTVSNNRTTGGNGAGLFNFNIAYLENNTFSGNVSPGDGITSGAILNSFGITTSGSLVITNVTIYSNTAAVGGGIAIASSSTVLTIKNSLVANNAGGNCDHTFGPITSLGHNLDSGNTCGFAATGDLTSTNPLVGPLLINPPGSTATHALLSGSPAINAADNIGCPAIDQRGIALRKPGVCDIGSYEAVVIDLTVTKAAAPDPVYVGRALTYTIGVTNIGTIPATGITLTDTLPTTVTYAASSFGGCTLITGNRVVCNLGAINVGAAITLTMRVTPTVEGSIVNTAIVAANETDSNLNNNTTSATTAVDPMADLTMFKTASTGIVNRNSLLTYTLHMNNNGPSVAMSITVTDSLPISVTTNSATGIGWTCNHAGNSVTCTRGSLPVGAAPNILIVVTTPNVGGVITNTATIAASTFDPNAANNTDDVSVTVTTTRFIYLPLVLKNG